MYNILIQTQIKCLEEELQTIKRKLSNNGDKRIYMSSLKDMFPQEIEYKTIKEAEIKLQK